MYYFYVGHCYWGFSLSLVPGIIYLLYFCQIDINKYTFHTQLVEVLLWFL